MFSYPGGSRALPASLFEARMAGPPRSGPCEGVGPHYSVLRERPTSDVVLFPSRRRTCRSDRSPSVHRRLGSRVGGAARSL